MSPAELGGGLSPVGLEGNDEDEVRAACNVCGWRGPWRESIRQALNEVDAHEADGCDPEATALLGEAGR